MQPVEMALLAVVAVLATALIATVVRPSLRSVWPRRAPAKPTEAEPAPSKSAPAPVAERPSLCPACRREFPPRLRFCPYDGRELGRPGDSAARAPGAGVTCPACRRSYDASKRFCPLDGEELLPLLVAPGGGPRPGPGPGGSLGKICPICSRRYGGEAAFCGRDGEELVAVN